MKKIRSAIILGLFFLLNAPKAIADVVGGPVSDPGVTSSNGLVNPLNGIDTFPQFLSAILDGVIQIGTIILIMMLVYIGFLFVVARGNAEKIQSARSALVWTVIGGLILLGAKSIQLVITGTVESITI